MLDRPKDDGTIVPAADLTAEELERCLGDWWWRITSGRIYQIKAKTEEDTDADDESTSGMAIPFIPNTGQMNLLGDLHNKNIVLKARQQGFSTLIEIMALDHAMFNGDQNVVVIAQNQNAAKKLFTDKVKYAYDRLPEALRDLFPLEERSQSHLLFGHNQSTIEVVSSARSGTVHFLHVSEMGKIAAETPDKARELTTGSLQAVPLDGFTFIESTAEGQGGAFYELAKRAEAKRVSGKILNPTDYNFFFSPWYISPEYRVDPKLVTISMDDHDYFDGVELEEDVEIDLWQRAWYVAKRDEEFAHEPTLMWREYPSTSAECWKSSTEGKYLAKLILLARAQGRIGKIPHRPTLPVNTFWDLGATDETVCWCHQAVNTNDHWINYREASGEGFLSFILWLERQDYIIGDCWLPHDASNKKDGVEQVTSLLSQVRAIRPSWNWRVVPRISTIQHGIDLLRGDFSTYYFDEEACKVGLLHLENYKRMWNTRMATWGAQPEHDEASHAADAIRQKAQAVGAASSSSAPLTPRTPAQRSGMTA
jgi:hypothetical protein